MEDLLGLMVAAERVAHLALFRASGGDPSLRHPVPHSPTERLEMISMLPRS